MREQPASDAWQVSIDTGGTFTDCVARDPEGRLHHAKVLSSSALRGKVEAPLDSTRLRVSVVWSAPRDFVRGFSLARGIRGMLKYKT